MAGSGATRVLLVEDNSLVALGTSEMLIDLGHEVTVAESGAAAMALIEAGTPFDLVITDHAMPGMTGIELAGHIQATRPGLPVILASGYAELPAGSAATLVRLDKPYRLDGLAAVIDSVLKR